MYMIYVPVMIFKKACDIITIRFAKLIVKYTYITIQAFARSVNSITISTIFA